MQSPGPKKILALDGGGIRGMIAVEILTSNWSILQDSFDLLCVIRLQGLLWQIAADPGQLEIQPGRRGSFFVPTGVCKYGVL